MSTTGMIAWKQMWVDTINEMLDSGEFDLGDLPPPPIDNDWVHATKALISFQTRKKT